MIRSVFGALTPGVELALTFDLKGSKQGRQASAKDRTRPGCCFKDNDFREQKMKIRLQSAEQVESLRTQMHNDSEYLKSWGIMDYSVLLGVRYIYDGDEPLLIPLPSRTASVFVRPPMPSSAAEIKSTSESKTATPRASAFAVARYNTTSTDAYLLCSITCRSLWLLCVNVNNSATARWSSHHGGTLAATPPSVPVTVNMIGGQNTRTPIGIIYYIGIIDMLTVYDASKKMAFAAKSIRHNSVRH